MSRYAIQTEPFTVIVGWDHPLGAYFAQVWEPELKGDQDGGCVYWIGTHPGSIRTIEDLKWAISSYVILSGEILAQLREDQRQSKPATPLQEWVNARLGPESMGDEQESEVVNSLHDHHGLNCGITTTSRCRCDTPKESDYCDDCDVPF